MIYFSTGEHQSMSPATSVARLISYGQKNIEVSGGVYSKDQLRQLIKFKSKANISLHNYFPFTETAFVFNLASTDELVSKCSIEMAKKAIELSHMLGASIYSFHAGFLVDPKPKQLGQNLGDHKIMNRDEATNLFLERVFLLSKFSEKYGIQLLIENNVLTKNNLEAFNQNPLLMVSPIEINDIMSFMPTNVGLLMDVGHLKVSSNTLGFELSDGMTTTQKFTKGYHLSDNDGLSDSNDAYTPESWFWPYLDNSVDYTTVEVYRTTAKSMQNLLDICMKNLQSNNG